MVGLIPVPSKPNRWHSHRFAGPNGVACRRRGVINYALIPERTTGRHVHSQPSRSSSATNENVSAVLPYDISLVPVSDGTARLAKHTCEVCRDSPGWPSNLRSQVYLVLLSQKNSHNAHNLSPPPPPPPPPLLLLLPKSHCILGIFTQSRREGRKRVTAEKRENGEEAAAAI